MFIHNRKVRGNMNDKKMIEQLCDDMYIAMVKKDETELERVHDDSFVLIHLTGMQQRKNEYIRAIMDGSLNYYSSEIENLFIRLNGNCAEVLGKSRMTASIFGGEKHTWLLELVFELKKSVDGWKFVRAEAATW